MGKQLEFNFDKENINKSTEKLANKIVDNNYNKSKNKNPFTQAAENARDLLSYTMKDGHLENKDNSRVKTVKEAIEINETLDKNFQDQKRDDYIKKLQRPGYQKISDQPIFKDNINHNPKFNKKSRTGNPSGRDYWREFVANGGKKLPEISPEDKGQLSATKIWNGIYDSMSPFEKGTWNAEQRKKKLENKKEEKEIEKDLRAREYKNKKAGKPPHANFSTSDQIVLETAKDKAREQLKEIKIPKINSALPDYLSYRENLQPIKKMPSLKEWMAARTPRQDVGITELKNVRGMKNIVDYSNKVFNLNNSKGIGPFLTGEDDE